VLTGLVVGKFCPLHRGHEALIAFAQARCDRLAILSYTKPELPGCPTELRARWLEALFPDAIRLVLDDAVLADFARRTGGEPRLLPHNDALDDVHRDFTAWVCLAMLGVVIDRVFTSEAYGDGFAASLTRYFRANAATSHTVEHIAFDPQRRQHPVSGTQMRDGGGHGRFLPDVVRASLVRRVGLIGGESTGKTTLASALAERYGTRWVPEYGRELWEARAGKLVFDDLLMIATEQIAREEAALASADRWLFCDTTPLVTAFYSQALFGRIDPRLTVLAQRPYANLLLCAADFAFVQDGTRRDAAFRQDQNAWYAHALEQARLPHRVLTGPIEQRLDQVADMLGDRV
jgi:HTH-type transcriptional regulator, transcriptional repressor of NAD biosynthesis genes